MVKYIFYVFFINFIANNAETGFFKTPKVLKNNPIITALKDNKIASTLQDNQITTAIKDNLNYTTITNFIKDNQITAAIQDNLNNTSITNFIKDNQITAAIQDNLNYDTITNFIKDGVKLNCFGIPVEFFANVVETMFTQTTKAENVRFYFYSRDQAEPVTLLSKTRNFDLGKINFSTERKTVVISHGFMSSGTVDWVKDMARAFLEMDDLNVIIVDWEQGSNTWNYVSASISTRIVGTQIAMLLYEIKQIAQAAQVSSENFGKVHFVGHSLGSHICAHASYRIQQFEQNDSLKWTVERITGLDPAQPCFTVADLTLKLDQTDALYVDVIHTNARQILFLGLGLPEQLGHNDFYPNGGQIQLGCDDINPTIWSNIMLPATIIKRTVCSHGRSYQLFTDSIDVKISEACTYQGHPWDRKYENLTELLKEDCDDVCPELGINSINYFDAGKNGTYFVPTADKSHFCEVTDEHRSAIKKQLHRDEMTENRELIGLAAERLLGVFDKHLAHRTTEIGE